MTLTEEYENQQSWHTDPEKLTFIICERVKPEQEVYPSLQAKVIDAEDRMIGDINFFIYVDDETNADDTQEKEIVEETGQYDGADEAGTQQTEGKIRLRGEVDVMIAEQRYRRRGYGKGSVMALLMFLRRNMRSILDEYSRGVGITREVEMTTLMVKIKEENMASRQLFGWLGFKECGGVNYFGEVTMIMPWEAIDGLVDQWLNDGEVYGQFKYEE